MPRAARKAPIAPTFSTRVVRWQRAHGRNGLPWQGTRDPYRIWLSEIMLQQTQVATVIPYYARFLERFPTVRVLAEADPDEVMAAWSGLGYYARARNLQRAAREVQSRFGGEFPGSFDALATLPGVGRSTAAAICAFASGERRAILDANVRRVLCRHGGIDADPASAATRDALWAAAEARLPRRGIEAYTQGMMDLGAVVCLTRNPRCSLCPVAADCVALSSGRIAELPAPRARRERPRRHVAMLVVLSRGEVLLEKRPARGIWGGLWSLPEGEVSIAPEHILERDWGIAARTVSALDPFEHGFTPFTLEVTPWRIDARRPARARSGRAGSWLALQDVDGAALPSPVKRLLRSIAAGAGTSPGSRGAASRR
jgi:A/G-specific adenine glycosylase